MEKEYIKHLQQVKKVGTKLYIDDLHDVVPVGTILYTASPTPPNGYLICNGATVGRGTYPDLFAAIGTTYGDGDGSTTFQLPNLMDKTVWGGTGVGTEKEAGLPNITGGTVSTVDWGDDETVGGGAVSITYRLKPSHLVHNTAESENFTDLRWDFDASRSDPIYGNSDTVQPPATVLLPVIKAFGHIANPGDLDASKLAQDIATLSADMSGYLPLSGGAMTGNIVLPNGGYIGTPVNSSTEVLISSSSSTHTEDGDDLPDSYLALRDSRHPTLPGVASMLSKYNDTFYSLDLNAKIGELTIRTNDDARYGTPPTGEAAHFFPVEQLVKTFQYNSDVIGYFGYKYASGLLVYGGYITVPANWTHVAIPFVVPFDSTFYHVSALACTALGDVFCCIGERATTWCDLHRRRSTDLTWDFPITCEFTILGHWKGPFAG